MTEPRRTSRYWINTYTTSVVAATITRATALPRNSRRTESTATIDQLSCAGGNHKDNTAIRSGHPVQFAAFRRHTRPANIRGDEDSVSRWPIDAGQYAFEPRSCRHAAGRKT